MSHRGLATACPATRFRNYRCSSLAVRRVRWPIAEHAERGGDNIAH
ncbi:MAG: hypothetical protein HYY06_05450 [Deltaproteobacteria bacterium]|nr:hypothetical protein [Deltaproteobacteria bacterium]